MPSVISALAITLFSWVLILRFGRGRWAWFFMTVTIGGFLLCPIGVVAREPLTVMDAIWLIEAAPLPPTVDLDRVATPSRTNDQWMDMFLWDARLVYDTAGYGNLNEIVSQSVQIRDLLRRRLSEISISTADFLGRDRGPSSDGKDQFPMTVLRAILMENSLDFGVMKTIVHSKILGNFRVETPQKSRSPSPIQLDVRAGTYTNINHNRTSMGEIRAANVTGISGAVRVRLDQLFSPDWTMTEWGELHGMLLTDDPDFADNGGGVGVSSRWDTDDGIHTLTCSTVYSNQGADSIFFRFPSFYPALSEMEARYSLRLGSDSVSRDIQITPTVFYRSRMSDVSPTETVSQLGGGFEVRTLFSIPDVAIFARYDGATSAYLHQFETDLSGNPVRLRTDIDQRIAVGMADVLGKWTTSLWWQFDNSPSQFGYGMTGMSGQFVGKTWWGVEWQLETIYALSTDTTTWVVAENLTPEFSSPGFHTQSFFSWQLALSKRVASDIFATLRYGAMISRSNAVIDQYTSSLWTIQLTWPNP